jgi:hypothetical protein
MGRFYEKFARAEHIHPIDPDHNLGKYACAMEMHQVQMVKELKTSKNHKRLQVADIMQQLIQDKIHSLKKWKLSNTIYQGT